MSILVAILLGVIQGLTEFIPISSTAHLTIVGALTGVINPQHPEGWTAFIATIQLGTLVAVIAFFRRDISSMITHFIRENLGAGRKPIAQQSVDARLLWFVGIGTIPVVVVGLALKDVIEGPFTKDLRVIAIALIGIALLLWIAEKRASLSRTSSEMTFADALIIGASQILALIPGCSRSGSTMMAGLFRGLSREHAARFSFLLSIPAILGAGVLEFASEFKNIQWNETGVALVVATLAALVSGYWSIGFLLRFLRTNNLNVFILYRIAIGVGILVSACTPQEEVASSEKRIASELKPMTADTASASAPVPTADTAVITASAVVKTSMGTFTVGLYGNDAPLTVRNFVELAKKHYYDGILFHRIVEDYAIQAGDPKTKDASAKAEWGRGGETANGKPLPEELNPSAPSSRIGYQFGVLAMARTPDPNSGTSQFFICLEKATSFPHQYTIFGRVTNGLNVVSAIGATEFERKSPDAYEGIPKKPVVIKSVRIK